MAIERKLAAIMFTAIPDNSSISARDEEEALTLLENQTQALTPIIEEYGGTLHKKLGDGLLISFSTITNAVICASKFQKKAQSIENLNLRISIHEGEITFKDDDILGKHVNLSALILRYSTVGGVVISDKVYQNISNVPEFETKYICEENFQGFSEKTKIYAITSHDFKFNPIDSSDKPNNGKSLIKTLLERKIPQILASYLIAGTSLILFIEYLVEKYQFPSQYPTLALFAILGILPSVVILAYFHGAPGKDEWTKIEKVGIPINVLFIAGILFFGDSMNIWEIEKVNEKQINIRDTFLINFHNSSEINKWIKKIDEYEDFSQLIEVGDFPDSLLEELKKYNMSYLATKYMNLDVNLHYPSKETIEILDQFPPYQYLDALENINKSEYDSLRNDLQNKLLYIYDLYKKDGIYLDGILNHALVRLKMDLPDMGQEWVRFFDYTFWEIIGDKEINHWWHDEGFADIESDNNTDIIIEVAEEAHDRIYEFRDGSDYIGEVVEILDKDLIKIDLSNLKIAKNMKVKLARIYSLGKEDLDTKIDDYRFISDYFEQDESRKNKYLDVYIQCKSSLDSILNNYSQILLHDSTAMAQGKSILSDDGFNDTYGEIISITNSEAIVRVKKKEYPFSKIKLGDAVHLDDVYKDK